MDTKPFVPTYNKHFNLHFNIYECINSIYKFWLKRNLLNRFFIVLDRALSLWKISKQVLEKMAGIKAKYFNKSQFHSSLSFDTVHGVKTTHQLQIKQFTVTFFIYSIFAQTYSFSAKFNSMTVYYINQKPKIHQLVH